jgi:hypothetical protein
MTNAQLKNEHAKLSEKSSELNSKLIEAGRGSEKFNETAAKTDPLAVEYHANYLRRSALRQEVMVRYGPSLSIEHLRAGGARLKKTFELAKYNENHDELGRFAGDGGGGGSPLDRDGNPLEDMDGKPIDLNNNGTITLYHRTSPEAAQKIKETGKFTSKENTNETFFSTRLNGDNSSGYGTSVVIAEVKPSQVRINDAFHGKEVHVAVSNKFLSRRNIVSVRHGV